MFSVLSLSIFITAPLRSLYTDIIFCHFKIRFKSIRKFCSNLSHMCCFFKNIVIHNERPNIVSVKLLKFGFVFLPLKYLSRYLQIRLLFPKFVNFGSSIVFFTWVNLAFTTKAWFPSCSKLIALTVQQTLDSLCMISNFSHPMCVLWTIHYLQLFLFVLFSCLFVSGLVAFTFCMIRILWCQKIQKNMLQLYSCYSMYLSHVRDYTYNFQQLPTFQIPISCSLSSETNILYLGFFFLVVSHAMKVVGSKEGSAVLR